MNEKTKITELLNQSDSNFDKKNKINRGYGIVSENVVADIESNGITSELLDQFKFPVFKYKTQITLHGKFETGNNYFITGGYKNLIVNKNKSLGVRYSAIDIKKKLLIYNILRLEKSRFSASMNSTSYGILTYLPLNEENLSALKQVFELIPSNYVGFKRIYVSESLYGRFIVINITLNAIYDKDVYSFIAGLLQKDYSEDIYKENTRLKEIEDQKQREKYELERKIEVERKKQLFGTKKEEFVNKNSIQYIHSFNEGRYLFLKFNYNEEIEVKILHVFRNRNKMYMHYYETLNDLTNLPETDVNHYERKQLKEFKLKKVKDRLTTDHYFKLAA
tara:strand:- start:820 stop:1821 length:1002 start_codon:yes stop_codon:yes gene_type:complete